MKRLSYLALVGNGETAALVSHLGALGWFCAPRFDSLPFFAQSLDPRHGGSLGFRPRREEEVRGRQRYLADTAHVVTRLVTPQGWLRITDWMPWGERALVRDVQAGGATQWQLWLEPPSAHSLAVALQRQGPLSLLIRETSVLALGWADGGDLEAWLQPDVRRRLVLGYGETEAEAISAWRQGARADRGADAARWRNWLPLPGPGQPASVQRAVARSLITLKLLIYEPTGAPLAAPTASFPATPGGGDNWDYRYVWLRDGTYSALAFDAVGLHSEARRFYDFALPRMELDGHFPQPLYTVDGTLPMETEVKDLAGPGGEQPVRFGNQAAQQLQLDSEGSILFGVERHVHATQDVTWLAHVWPQLVSLAAWIGGNWRKKEHGIWEFREVRGHWLYSRTMTWAGLRAAARLAERLGYREEAAAWRRIAREVRATTLIEAWDPRRNRFLACWGLEWQPAVAERDATLDASVIAPIVWRLVGPKDRRATATLAALLRPVAEGGLQRQSGVQRFPEAAMPFYLCTFGAMLALWRLGHRFQARRLWHQTLATMTETGLMAEHYLPETGAQWGNFPQAFSHQGLILAADLLWGTYSAAQTGGGDAFDEVTL